MQCHSLGKLFETGWRRAWTLSILTFILGGPCLPTPSAHAENTSHPVGEIPKINVDEITPGGAATEFPSPIVAFSRPGGSSAVFCAVLKDGSLWCTGVGSTGIFGEDHPENPGGWNRRNALSEIDNRQGVVEKFIRLNHIGNVVEAASGADFVCALREEGDVWCWGGRTGATPVPYDVHTRHPEQITGIPKAKHVYAGGDMLCIVDASNELFCTKPDATTGRAAVDMVDLGIKVVDVALSDEDVGCAVDLDGKVFCWGRTRRLTACP